MKAGDKIRIVRMEDNNGKDWQAAKMNGIEGRIEYIDSAGQIHLEGYGLAIIPGVDSFVIICDSVDESR